jgi:hypothetical protein
VTVTVWVIPPPVNVTVPLREDDPELAAPVIETAPLPVPDAGVAVIQLWLAVTLHDTFEVIDAFLVSTLAPKFRLAGDTVSDAMPSCLTVTSERSSPSNTDTFPVLSEDDSFAPQVTVTVFPFLVTPDIQLE